MTPNGPFRAECYDGPGVPGLRPGLTEPAFQAERYFTALPEGARGDLLTILDFGRFQARTALKQERGRAMTMPTVLLTGATGFLGGAAAAELLRQPAPLRLL